MIERCLREKEEERPGVALYRGSQETQLGQLAVVEFVDKRGGAKVVYKVNPERGYLPVESLVLVQDDVVLRRVITDIEGFSGGRWFPKRSLSIQPGGHGGAMVRVFNVEKLDVDRPISERMFSIRLKNNVALLHNDGNPASQFLLKDCTSINVRDLPTLVKRGHDRSAKVAAVQGDPGGVGDVSAVRKWLTWGSITTLAIIIIALVARHRRRGHGR